MSATDESGPRGRLLLVTAARAPVRAALAAAVAGRLDRAVLVDGAALEQALCSGAAPGWDDPPTSEQLRLRLLRWSAALAVAETYQLEGFDAIVSEDALGDRLEDFLDLVEPEPVHVVVVRDDADPATPHWGLWVGTDGTDDAADTDATADDVVERLADALVLTAETD
ncbi:hypothetical protein GCM10009868_27790 [Terrabacter aerolatus]|uniref:Uncharacterized protein n=1 Tax=Terrabacter aerolatus TaxID=422442 RepID=A0A512CX36_9MICO|nr:hypothetical protein [Terrabacter aerolatus]GEO28766.1 hypothetical protein TAE01_05760 [Terrabacter aerolatus]